MTHAGIAFDSPRRACQTSSSSCATPAPSVGKHDTPPVSVGCFSYEIVVGNSFSICIIIQASSNFYICFLICQRYSHHSSYRAYTKLLLNTSMFLSWLLSPTLTTHTFLSPLGYFRCLLETVVSSTSSMRSP